MRFRRHLLPRCRIASARGWISEDTLKPVVATITRGAGLYMLCVRTLKLGGLGNGGRTSY